MYFNMLLTAELHNLEDTIVVTSIAIRLLFSNCLSEWQMDHFSKGALNYTQKIEIN